MFPCHFVLLGTCARCIYCRVVAVNQSHAGKYQCSAYIDFGAFLLFLCIQDSQTSWLITSKIPVFTCYSIASLILQDPTVKQLSKHVQRRLSHEKQRFMLPNVFYFHSSVHFVRLVVSLSAVDISFGNEMLRLFIVQRRDEALLPERFSNALLTKDKKRSIHSCQSTVAV